MILQVAKPARKLMSLMPLLKKHENDKIHQVYTKTYSRMDSRKCTMYISKKEFTKWNKAAREKRKLREEGQLTLEEFQACLVDSKCR